MSAQRRGKNGRRSNPPARRDNTPARREARPENESVARSARLSDQEIELRQLSYSGPLPHPDILERYAEIEPGAVKLILDNFDAQGQHRRSMEQTVVSGSERRANIGQFLATSLLGAAIIGGCLVATVNGAAGAGIVGTALGGGALVYLVGGRPPRPDDD